MISHTVREPHMEYEVHPADDESTHLFVRNLPALYGTPLALGRDPEETLDLVIADWKTPRQGDIVARRYRVGERLSRTGHVVTVSARHLELEQSVNLTYLAAPALGDEHAVDAFSRRARLVSQVSTSHTARVLDAGRLVFGAPFVVLEQLPGWTLAEVLRMRGRLPWKEAADLVLQACRALQEAYAGGVDRVGPNMTNLVVTREPNGVPVVRTVLFGAESAATGYLSPRGPAWAADDVDDESTLPYLSPEDVQGPREHDGERADVWALGAVFFELYTGARAFSGESTVRLLTRIVAEATPELYALRPEAPAEVRELLERCLAKDPFERYATVDDLATALGALARSTAAPRAASPPSRQGARVPPTPPPVAPVALSAARASRASLGDRALTLTVGVAIGVLVVAAAQVLGHPTPASAHPGVLPSLERP